MREVWSDYDAIKIGLVFGAIMAVIERSPMWIVLGPFLPLAIVRVRNKLVLDARRIPR